MRFRLEFDVVGDALTTDRTDETCRLLRAVMGRVGAGDVEGPVIDGEGLVVGSWAFTSGEEGNLDEPQA